MKITVEFAAQVKRAAGHARDEIELDGDGSIAELFARLVERHSESLGALLLTADGSPQPSLLVFVGDEQVRDRAAQRLTDGDVVTILSPISGG